MAWHVKPESLPHSPLFDCSELYMRMLSLLKSFIRILKNVVELYRGMQCWSSVAKSIAIKEGLLHSGYGRAWMV